jgi:hypothetical protein
MSMIPAKETERNHDEHDGPGPACVPPANRTCEDHESLPLRLARQSMRVKLCSRCPYTPRDLAGHYDPEGIIHVCAKCDREREPSTNHYPRNVHRRQKCATVPNIPGTEQPSVARSATESLASYGTTAAEPPSVQRNALTASRHARKVIADGCVGFTPPDNGSGKTPAAISRSSEFRSKEPAQ